jgi:hypothetical protein
MASGRRQIGRADAAGSDAAARGAVILLQLVERDLQIGGGLHALCRVLAQAAHDDTRQLRWQVLAQIPRRRRLFTQHRRDGRHRRVARKGAAAGRQLVEQGAEREDVRARIERAALGLFG